jgi:hypothetical protein
MKKPAVAGFFISAIDPLPIERAAANAKPGTEDFNGQFSSRTRQYAAAGHCIKCDKRDHAQP